MTDDRPNILTLTRAAFEELAKERVTSGLGMAGVIYRRAHQRGEFEPEGLRLNERSVRAWRGAFRLELPKVTRTVREAHSTGDETIKACLDAGDGLEYEMVRVPMGKRRPALCISSQVGCRLACTFCETGRMGRLRDLRVDEIVGQVIVARQLGWDPGSVVFQGMGEPLDNLDAVIPALHLLVEKSGLGFAHPSITMCTSGDVEGLRALAALRWKRLNLSLSLNAALDELRDEIMPINRRYPLAEVQRALMDYRQRENFSLGVHYCLLPGINDRPEDLTAIAEFCAPLGRAVVSVIGYNPGSDPITRAPSDEEVMAFVMALRDLGVSSRPRITKGRGVMAACGQLGNPELRKNMRASKSMP